MPLSLKEQQRLKLRYGPWAVITGARSGIGKALATELACAGFNLIINARDEARLIAVETEIKNHYKVKVLRVAADLSTPAGIQRLIAESQPLEVGLLVNNSGYGSSGLFMEQSIEDEINMLHVNCRAVMELTHHFSNRFKQQQKGGIIFLSSLVAFQGVPYASHYAATKAYVQSLAEGLCRELEPYGIDILAAVPGPVNSGFAQRANLQMNQAAEPGHIAAPILSALGKQRTVVPGFFSKLLVYSLRTVPRFLKISIMHQVMWGFTKHQRS